MGIMSLSFERVMIAAVVASLAVTSTGMLVGMGEPITREEAVGISRNTRIIYEAFTWGGELAYGEHVVYELDVHYWNTTYIGRLKEKYPNVVEWQNLPTDHGVWRVDWNIIVPGYLVGHYIDELTGQILFEGYYYIA
jgi:hypothetical protein